MVKKLIDFLKGLLKKKPKQIFCVVCLKEIDSAKDKARMEINDNPACTQCLIRKFKAKIRRRGALMG